MSIIRQNKIALTFLSIKEIQYHADLTNLGHVWLQGLVASNEANGGHRRSPEAIEGYVFYKKITIHKTNITTNKKFKYKVNDQLLSVVELKHFWKLCKFC